MSRDVNDSWLPYILKGSTDNYVEKLELNNIVEIKDYTFFQCNIQNVDLNGVQKIGVGAFAQSELLGDLNIPKNCEVDSYAFSGCEKLKGKLTLGDSVKMSDSAFEGCPFKEANLSTTVSLFDGNSVTKEPAEVIIGENAFLEQADKITFMVNNAVAVDSGNVVKKTEDRKEGFCISASKLPAVEYILASNGKLENKSANSLTVFSETASESKQSLLPGKSVSVEAGKLIETTLPASFGSSGENKVPSGPSAPTGGGGAPSAPTTEETAQKEDAKEEEDKNAEVKEESKEESKEEAKQTPAKNTRLTDKSNNTYRVTKRGKEVSFIGNKKKACDS